MSQAILPELSDESPRAPARPASIARAATLEKLDLRAPARVRRIVLGEAETEWVRAVGIFEGEEVCVLRRAAFGGPIHVRTGSGGEFAIDRSLAEAIEVET